MVASEHRTCVCVSMSVLYVSVHVHGKGASVREWVGESENGMIVQRLLRLGLHTRANLFK